MADLARTLKVVPAVTSAAIAAALLCGAAASASAQPQSGDDVHIMADHEMYTADQSWPYDPAGHMWFNEYGDVVTLCDNDADGQKVTLAVTTPSGSGYGMSVGGEGNCVTHKASEGGKYNLPEDKVITFEISAIGDPESDNQAGWLNDH
jgi:hypothetical protein